MQSRQRMRARPSLRALGAYVLRDLPYLIRASCLELAEVSLLKTRA